MINVLDLRKVDKERPLTYVMSECIWKPFLTYFYEHNGFSVMQANDDREHYDVFIGVYNTEMLNSGKRPGSFSHNRKEVFLPYDGMTPRLLIPNISFYNENKMKDLYYFTYIDYKVDRLYVLGWPELRHVIDMAGLKSTVRQQNVANIYLSTFELAAEERSFYDPNRMAVNVRDFLDEKGNKVYDMVRSLSERYASENWAREKSAEDFESVWEDAIKVIKNEMFKCYQPDREVEAIITKYFLSPMTEEDYKNAIHIY